MSAAAASRVGSVSLDISPPGRRTGHSKVVSGETEKQSVENGVNVETRTVVEGGMVVGEAESAQVTLLPHSVRIYLIPICS